MLTDERILSIANMVNLKMRVRVDDLDLVEFARAVEAETLEAAAKACDLRINGTGPHCAEAIRALKEGKG